MSNVVAAVKFGNTEKSYFYGCDMKGLNKGDKIKVDSNDGEFKTARFVGYTTDELIGFNPNKKVVGKVMEGKKLINGKNLTKRTQAEIDHDTTLLYNFLEKNRPTAMTSIEIAKFMGWDEKSATSNIKTSMRRNSKIINYDYNLYTIRKSDQAKYKFATEVK